MNNKTVVSAVSLLVLSMPVAATDMFVEAGLHLGGDTIASTTANQDLKAGQLISLAVGVHSELAASVQGRLSLGYKFDTISANDGDASFSRFPIEALILQQSGNFMLGGGIAYHLSPEFEINSPGANGTIEFDDALGFVLAFDYNSKGKFAGDWYVGGRVTLIDYEVSGFSISGNSIGAVVGYMWE